MKIRHLVRVSVLSIAAAAAVITPARRADACGGCFTTPVQQSRTVVAGHRMIVSISNTQTTLWDQIVYSGSPESFAWVLPVKGLAEVGLSSDALFENLEAATQIQILSPTVFCPGGSGGPSGAGSCSSGFASSAATSGGSTSGDVEDPVQVVSHTVVGPYETVQLSSSDPAALNDWLAAHGYDVPMDVVPVIDAYVGEGFDFLALKLVPGQGVDAMQPVRVSAPGANSVLPLRMVAAGAGAFTPITLWILGEGRYEPANFPWFTIDESDLFWDWNMSSSNYKELRADAYAMSNNEAWQVETASPFAGMTFQGALLGLAMTDPVGSGYADEMGQGAVEACQADLDDLFASLDPASIWVTRIRAELARAALASDLDLAAASDQSAVSGLLQVPDTNMIGSPCAFADCYSGSSGTSGAGANGDGSSDDADGDSGGCDSACAIGEPAGFRWSLAALAALGIGAALRRRRS